MSDRKKRHTHAEKRAWVFARLMAEWEYEKRTSTPPGRPFISGADQDDQEAWETAFGGKTVFYWIGPNVSPDFARTLRRMWKDGDLKRAVVGNPDWSKGEKTYHISYTFAQWPLSEEPHASSTDFPAPDPKRAKHDFEINDQPPY